jgi:hypothetical protein
VYPVPRKATRRQPFIHKADLAALMGPRSASTQNACCGDAARTRVSIDDYSRRYVTTNTKKR